MEMKEILYKRMQQGKQYYNAHSQMSHLKINKTGGDSEPQYEDTAASGADAGALQSIHGSFVETMEQNLGASSSVLISDVKIEEYMLNKSILLRHKENQNSGEATSSDSACYEINDVSEVIGRKDLIIMKGDTEPSESNQDDLLQYIGVSNKQNDPKNEQTDVDTEITSVNQS